MVMRKKVEGQIDYSDGEFAEVQTIGIKGIEKDLWLGTLQIHRENTRDTPEEFQRRFPVGMWLDILINHHSHHCGDGRKRAERRQATRLYPTTPAGSGITSPEEMGYLHHQMVWSGVAVGLASSEPIPVT